MLTLNQRFIKMNYILQTLPGLVWKGFFLTSGVHLKNRLAMHVFLFFFWIASTLSIISIKKNERLQKIAWQCAKWTMTPKMNTVWNKNMAIGNLIINEVSYDKHINPFYWNWISNTSANRQKNWFWIQFPHNVLTFNDKSHLIFLS